MCAKRLWLCRFFRCFKQKPKQNPKKGNILDLKDTKLTLNSLSLSAQHPLAQKLRALSKEGKAFQESFKELQRKLAITLKEAKDNFKSSINDESKKRFYEMLETIINANPEYPSAEILKIMEELKTWREGDIRFVTEKQLNRVKASFKAQRIKIEKEAFEEFKKWLLKVDHIAIGVDAYNPTLLEDPNSGHWDIYPSVTEDNPKKTTINPQVTTFEFDTPLQARHPLSKGDIKKVQVAIDFGTKSTTAAYLDQQGYKNLISIGTKDTTGEALDRDYENPTFMEFRRYKKFCQEYGALQHRPFTNIDDLNIAHGAFENFKGAEGNDYYRFFYKLKQWAGTSGNEFKVMDLDKQPWDLGDLSDYGVGKPNPIEIYAYILGRYINNMLDTGGVYLTYFLSYPVKYEKDQAERIRSSFERGIRKSLPHGIFDKYKNKKGEEKQEKLRVELRASEPAAYAISALQAFGFDQISASDAINYGVFDFGGGTTDFDFGVWEESTDPKYAFELHHFNPEGMKYLGGENLLELLALQVFKENLEAMRAKKFVIATPNYDPSRMDTQQLRNLLSNSREGRRNLQTIAHELRPFMENLNTEHEELKEEMLDLNLFQIDGGDDNAELKINYEALLETLKKEIGLGVENFFHALRVASEKMKNATTVHIFLAGNASRSPLVKELFLKEAEKERAAFKHRQSQQISNKEPEDIVFELYPPLGTPEADAKIKELTGHDPESAPHRKVTCKTGVVFGLLDSRDRPRGGIRICSEVCADTGPQFKFHLGYEKKRHFQLLINKREMQVGAWVELFEEFEGDSVEIFYTDKPKATSNQMAIHESSRRTIHLDEEYSEALLKVVSVNTDTIKVGIFDKEGASLYESEEIHLD
ncbi:hypothetical protein [Helicobacter salomonis]|uniref:hypothetical protein n=1 Tax=Helicobacter salomonis TaxID=56878 RepID=UPI000CF0F456|nr:hypothetical protein [Helicobacter salomonis]